MNAMWSILACTPARMILLLVLVHTLPSGHAKQCATGTNARSFPLNPTELRLTAGGPGIVLPNATLLFTADANLRMVDGKNNVLWNLTSSDGNCTVNPQNCTAVFQGDGNFCVHNHLGHPLFATETYNEHAATMVVQDFDPFLQIFDTECKILWWTSNHVIPPGPVDEVKYYARQGGFHLFEGDSIDIKDVSLYLSYGCNLQINDTSTAGDGNILWETKTHGTNCTFSMGSDGNCILHSCVGPKCRLVWATWTYNQNMGYLEFRNQNPYLEFFSGSGELVWSDLGVPSFNHSQLGGIYDIGQVPAVSVYNVPGPNISWVLYDWYGVTVASGTSTVSNATTGVVVKPTQDTKLNQQYGYYDFSVNGANTSIAFVPDNAAIQSAKPHPFGVGTHFSQGTNVDLIPLIKKLGVNRIRDNAGAWNGVEQVKGVFNFTKSHAYMDPIKEAGLKMTTVAAFSNALYCDDDRAAPTNMSGYEAYANFCVETLNEFPWLEAMEIWNEYIGSFVDGPALANKTLYYTQMIKVAAEKIRAKHSEVVIVGGAAEDIPLPSYFEEIDLGLLESCDAICIHPYGYHENVIPKLGVMEKYISDHNSGKTMPVYATEWSMQTEDTSAGRRDQAVYAAQFATAMHASGVAAMYYFLINDFQSWPRGFVRSSKAKEGKYAVTPGFVTFGTVIHLLAATEFVGRETALTSPAMVLRFKNTDGTDVRVMWATADNASMVLTASRGQALGNAIQALDIQGNPIPGFVEALGKPFLLTASPIYVLGAVGVQDPAQIPLADSYVGFSYTQGQDNWHYGYYGPEHPPVFHPAALSSDIWLFFWVGPEPYCRVYDIGGVPGSTSPSVRRWVANVTATVMAKGVLWKPNGGGQTVSGSIVHNGALLHNYTALPGVEVEFTSQAITVKAGANVTYPIDDHTHFAVRLYPTEGLDTRHLDPSLGQTTLRRAD